MKSLSLCLAGLGAALCAAALLAAPGVLARGDRLPAGAAAPTRKSAVAVARRPGVPPEAVAPERIEALSRAYLGVPYRLDCLGEATGPDPDPLYTRDAADCQTLVEQVMAEAIAPWVGGLNAAIRLTRYYGGTPRLENRYHYCIPDWLDHPWPVRDATAEIAAGELKREVRTIDREPLLASRGAAPSPSGRRSPIPVRRIETAYIPRERVAAVADRIPSGSIVVFVLNQPDIVAGHLGFLFRREGELVLRHASQTRKQVIDEPLAAYLERAPKRFVGVQILRPDVAGLTR